MVTRSENEVGRDARIERRRRASIERMKDQIRREGVESFERRTLKLATILEPYLRRRHPDHPALQLLDAHRPSLDPEHHPARPDRPTEVVAGEAGESPPTGTRNADGSEHQLHLGLG
jgi:hypothetical protein